MRWTIISFSTTLVARVFSSRMLVSRLRNSCVDKVIREVCIKYCTTHCNSRSTDIHGNLNGSSHSCELAFDLRFTQLFVQPETKVVVL
ncbi:hypothetical protein EDD22DRAFT_602872 [Suillus occidentalis]|nr:hypothetical protein EDD22DRAFT_602872 [Suillus occidentalis]